MPKELDYNAIVAGLDEDKRTAILLMGEATDTCEGFEIPVRVMQQLQMQELVNVDDEDEHARRPVFWLNRNGLACHEIIRNQNIAAKRR